LRKEKNMIEIKKEKKKEKNKNIKYLKKINVYS